MGRHRQPEIRQRLLAACTDHALAHGLPDRLAPLAQAAGTSPRMLLYHFASKEGLQRDVLREARARQRRDFEQLLRPREGEPYLDVLARAWEGMTDQQGLRYLAVFGKLREDAEQRLWPGFRVEATTDWMEPLRAGLASTGRPELATLVLAVVRGLVMDLDATGDAERTRAAWADFVDALRCTAPPAGQPLALPAAEGHPGLRA